MKKNVLTAAVALAAATSCSAQPVPDIEELVKLVREKTIFADLSAEKLREGAARGLTTALDEALGRPPFAVTSSPAFLHRERHGRDVNAFYTPNDLKLLKQEVAGQFGGIGAKIGLKQHRREWRDAQGRTSVLSTAVEVLEAIAGSAAERAGLERGDRIVAIDGTPVGARQLGEIVGELRGPAGTAIRLTVDRAGGEPFDVSVTRELVRVPAISYENLGGGLGRLAVTALTPNTRAELQAALASNPAALVLDLRGCPGGQLDAAIDVAGAFLPSGTHVLTLREAGGSERTLVTTANPIYSGPLVALVGRETASGAEIIAAALQSSRRALVAGEKTYGKRTAETIFELGGGYACKLSTAFFRRPGTQADGAGFPVVPDVPLAASHPKPGDEMGPPDENAPVDPQLEACRALLGWRAPR